MDIDSILNAGGLPPRVEIMTDSHTIEAESTEIGVEVCDKGGGVENLNFYVDNKAIRYLSITKAFRVKKESY